MTFKRRMALVLLLCGACEPPSRAVRIELVVRGSCGRSTQTYDISCVSSLELSLVDAHGQVLASQCTSVPGQYGAIHDLVTARELLPVLENVESHDGAHLEFRAYHAFDKPPCEDLVEADLMLWGSSAPLNLTNESLQTVTVELECRPTCDCELFDREPAMCPPALVPGVCTPLEVQLCQRECDNAGDCYGGLLACVDGRCTSSVGGVCAPCSSGADCDSGRCIRNLNTSEQFCAQRCPPSDSATVCPTRMSCRRADGAVFEEL